MSGFSARYDQALGLAARAHRNQLRKGSDLPYIAHVVHVSVILIRYGFSEELAIAGLLHDVVEDCNIPIEQIEEAFGSQIADLVEAVSEQKSANGEELPWEQRKALKLEHLYQGGPEVAALKAADALHNMRSILQDRAVIGAQIWGRFKRGALQTLGYYQAILEGVRRHLPEHAITTELALAVDELEAAAVHDSQ